MKAVFTIVFGVFCFLGFSGAAHAACTFGEYSITDYGAVANDDEDDSEAIQDAIDAASTDGVVCVPVGVFTVKEQINVNRDDLTIRGEGIGSVFALASKTNVTILKIGEDESSPAVTSHNITVRNMAFDGNLNDGLTSTGGNFFGVWVERGEDITMRDLYFEDFFNDGITVSNGHVPSVNVLIERVNMERNKRTGIHIGFAEDVIIRNCVIDHSQDEATWGANAGNGIDVEVEGDYLGTPLHEGWVTDLLIEDTFIRNTNYCCAGTAIALQPAYGAIADVTIQRNVTIEKGIMSSGVDGYAAGGTLLHNTNINLNENWVSQIDSSAAFGGFAFFWTDGGTFNDNVITDYANGNSSMVRLSGADSIEGSDNQFFRPYQTNNIYNSAFMINTPYWTNSNLTFYNTSDNGYTDTRIVHFDPTAQVTPVDLRFAVAYVIGTSSYVGWSTNSNSTPTGSPSIISVDFDNNDNDLVVEVEDPNDLPVRLVALRNGFPVGMAQAVNGIATIELPAPALDGDYFDIRIYNQHGREDTHTFTW